MAAHDGNGDGVLQKPVCFRFLCGMGIANVAPSVHSTVKNADGLLCFTFFFFRDEFVDMLMTEKFETFLEQVCGLNKRDRDKITRSKMIMSTQMASVHE